MGGREGKEGKGYIIILYKGEFAGDGRKGYVLRKGGKGTFRGGN